MSSADNVAAPTVVPLFLRPHIFACVTATGGVFLDAQRHKYFALNAARMRALGTILHGCPPSVAGISSADRQDGIRLGIELVDAGLLTQDAVHGKPMTAVALEPAETQLEWDSDRPRVRVAHVSTFFSCALLTACTLRYRPKSQVIEALQRRKERCAYRQEKDSDAIRELAYIFRAIRPFGYTMKNHCLFDCLVLLRFLLIHGYCAALVFGVRAQPFFAHSWVQAGRCVLNCPAEYARSFTPILAL